MQVYTCIVSICMKVVKRVYLSTLRQLIVKSGLYYRFFSSDALTYLTEFPGLFFDRPVFAALKYLYPAVRGFPRSFNNIA